MFEQRIKIEHDYVAAIRKWSATSQRKIEHSPEYGTTRKAWLDSIRASELIAESHQDIAEGIQRDVVDKMMAFERKYYDMSLLHIKIAKELKKQFENIQKPWLKLLDELERAKKSYHEACRKLKKVETAEKSKESGDSDSAHRKMLMTLRCEDYKRLLKDMENAQPTYENSMKEVLSRADDIERERLTEFKLLLIAFHNAVNIERDRHLTKMSTDLGAAIGVHDTERDLQWWHDHYASDANNSWPMFEDHME